MNKNVNCIILTGGKSSRMGEDKVFLPFYNLVFFEKVIFTLSEIFQNFIISAKSELKFISYYNKKKEEIDKKQIKIEKSKFDFYTENINKYVVQFYFKNYLINSFTLIKDKISIFSSIVGLYSSLYFSNSNINLVIAADMPFIKKDLIEYLINISLEKKENKVILFKNKNYFEPFPGIYNKGITNMLEKQIKNNEFKINYFLQKLSKNSSNNKIGLLSLPVEVAKRYDKNLISFININNKEQYYEVLKNYQFKKF